HLEIVRLCAGESCIAGREKHDAVWKAEQLENFLRMTSQQLELVGRRLGRRISNELNLVEFVNANQSARVLAMRSCFTAKARTVSSQCSWQVARQKNLSGVEIRDRHFSGRNEK